jgi:NAD(P)H-hydrate epimerase
VALDVPSGLELAAGTLHLPHVPADATLTLAAPREGSAFPTAAAAVGDLFLADISIPSAVYARVGVDYRTPFTTAQLLHVTGL